MNEKGDTVGRATLTDFVCRRPGAREDMNSSSGMFWNARLRATQSIRSSTRSFFEFRIVR
jgi:hypothetical protein